MAPPRQLRYFLGSCTASPVTIPLINLIQASSAEHLILGTAHPEISTPLPDSCHLIDPTNIKIFQQLLFDSDVIIYDLASCDLKELEFAVQQLKRTNSEKYLICISSVMAWSDTQAKEKQETDDPELVDEESEGEEQAEGEAEVEKKQYVKFIENDYAVRQALPEFEYLISYETLCLSASVSQPSLKSYVLCAGVLYGDQQFSLYEHFKQAWLQQHVSSKQKNRIPMIHVRDLALFVYKITEKPPKNKYIFAVDHNKDNKQKKIFGAIFKGNSPQNNIEIEKNPELEIDLRILPSKVFEVEEAEEAVEEGEEGKEIENKEGLILNMNKLRVEFNHQNNLKANRIFIEGPPASGKTFYGEQLSKYYNVPLINIESVIELSNSLEGELQDEIREAKDAQRAEMAEKEQERLDALKDKNEKMGIPIVEDDYVVNADNLKPRIPDEILYKLYKLRLSYNDCQNRGYILEGFPRSFKDAQQVFMISQQQEGEEEEQEKAKILNLTTVPHTVFCFKATDQQLLEKVKGFPEEKIENSHYNEEGMKRRLAQYRACHSQESGKDTIINFFEQYNVESRAIDTTKDNVLEQAKFFIERNGKFKNFMTYEAQEEKMRKSKARQSKVYVERQEQEVLQEREVQETEQRELAEEIYKLKQKQQNETQINLLQTMSKPLVDYLEVNLMPFLQDGLKEVVTQKPEDPLDFLAQYLFKRSLEVKYADPNTFKK